MTMTTKIKFKEQPLKDLNLSGLHLIEASAGTGKTWTLSSLMVRILTEKYMPNQVIATTFTRAAAAELKTRIQLRLSEIQQYVPQWEALSHTQYDTIYHDLKDELAKIVFQKFRHDQNTRGFDYLYHRLNLVMDTLDELFVGTIDSFIQKILREFAFESGEFVTRQISQDENKYLIQVIHDILREWIQQQPQDIIDLLFLNHDIKTIDQYVKLIKDVLNFNQAILQPIQQPKIDIALFQQSCDALCQSQTQDLKSLANIYETKDGKVSGMNANSWKANSLKILLEQQIPYLQQLLMRDKNQLFIDAQAKVIIAILEKLKQKKGFNKGSEALQQQIFSHTELQKWLNFSVLVQALTAQLKQFHLYLLYYISVQVKQRLPEVLKHAGETTFAQQTQTLAQILQPNEHNSSLPQAAQQIAQAIQHRYPMILVDEFQDTSQEQDNILSAIWRDKDRLSAGCFVAVGDPKQAIYGFRGGDVLTYTNALEDIYSKKGDFYRLSYNYRSHPYLVKAVDALFALNPDFGEGIYYCHAYAGKDDSENLIEDQQKDQTPLRWLSIPQDHADAEAEFVAHKIKNLLIKAQNGKLYLEKNQQQTPIVASDIAVLVRSNRELTIIKQQLIQLGIPVSDSLSNNVLSLPIARDVLAILQAISQPDDEKILRRALITPMIARDQHYFQQLGQNAIDLSVDTAFFRLARQIWAQKGFLNAWQSLAQHYHFWQNLALHSAHQAERNVTNVRHIIEILSEKSRYYQGMQHLKQWYQLQLTQSIYQDWNAERKLSNDAGVQLMTIHKSKGLEFKIVFVLNVDQEINPRTLSKGLGFAEQDLHGKKQRVITVTQDEQCFEDESLKNISEERQFNEDHRIWYVALTRASYRMYLTLAAQEEQSKKSKTAGTSGVLYWLSHQDNTNKLTHQYTIDEDIDSDFSTSYLAQHAQPISLQAVDYPQKRFFAIGHTSFTGLTSKQHQPQQLDDFADVNEIEFSAADELNLLEHQPTEHQFLSIDSHKIPNVSHKHHQENDLAWIRQAFPRGTLAGTCLHDILEQLDFSQPQQWDREIYYYLGYYDLWQDLMIRYQQEYTVIVEDKASDTTEATIRQKIITMLKDWLQDIALTPLQDISVSSICLKNLPSTQRLAEMKFCLGLQDRWFDSKSIHQLFVDYGIVMPEFDEKRSARYLNGAIDVVYFDGQRYHVADYKSNFLGDCFTDYQTPYLQQNMTESSYWLQAALYLVALHRYLQHHLQDYQPEQHLGGASYLYLRGMQNIDSDVTGVNYWQPSVDFILQLNQCLGQSIPSSVDNFV